MAQLVWCEVGAHYYERLPKPGRIPASCSEHARSATSAAEESSTLATTRTRWLGDLKTCFLLERGWSFRLQVNEYLLDNKGGWRMPLSLAEALAMSSGEARELEPNHPGLGQTLEIYRRADALIGGPLGQALEGIAAEYGDLVFVALGARTYELVRRPRGEVGDGDPLGQMLWSCGLDPTNVSHRTSAWRRLGRVLGGSTEGRTEVRQRLQKRHDDTLLSLLDEIERSGLDRIESEPWAPGWQYKYEGLKEPTVHALRASDGSVRVAVGVVDTSGQPPRGLLTTDGGLCWLHQDAGFHDGELQRILKAPPRGLIPAAQRPAWVLWMRAEHAARRSALAGVEWSVRRQADLWVHEATGGTRLVEALTRVASADEPGPRMPESRVARGYPRSAVAFQRALDGAVLAGLQYVRADPLHGFRGVFAAGADKFGAALLDILC